MSDGSESATGAMTRPSFSAFWRSFSARIFAWATFCMMAGLGAITIVMARASIMARVSTFARSSVPETTTVSCSCAFSGWVISRPRKRTVNFTLWPASRKRRAALTLKSRSWSSVFGRSLISLISTTVCLRFASPAFFFSSYLYLPKSRILHTGGSDLGFTSTRSSPFS